MSCACDIGVALITVCKTTHCAYLISTTPNAIEGCGNTKSVVISSSLVSTYFDPNAGCPINTYAVEDEAQWSLFILMCHSNGSSSSWGGGFQVNALLHSPFNYIIVPNRTYTIGEVLLAGGN